MLYFWQQKVLKICFYIKILGGTSDKKDLHIPSRTIWDVFEADVTVMMM